MLQLPDKLIKKVPYQRNDRKRGYIAYIAHLRAYAIYSAMFGSEQTADRLAERGGFGEEELDFFYPEWRKYIALSEG